MRLRYSVRRDLRYAAQDRHRPACTTKSSRRLVYVFSPNVVSTRLRPTFTFSYAPKVREALPLASHDPRFKIHDLRFTVPFEYSASSYHVILHWSPDLETAPVTSHEKRSFTKHDFTRPTSYAMAHTNPITAPVLDDTNTNTNVNDTLPVNVPTSPMLPTFAPETMTLHGERNVTNDSESTAVHDAGELRSVILNGPGTTGILLRAYDDLRGRIWTSREAIMNELSERIVNDLTKRLATINTRNNDELATLHTRRIQLETRLRFTTRSASTPPHRPVVVESMHTNTVHDHGRCPLPAAPFKERVTTPSVTSNPFYYDAIPHLQMQTNREPQYVLTTFPHDFPLNDPTNVPGLEAKRTLLSTFKEVVSYETYRLRDKRSVLYASEGGETHGIKKRVGGLLPTLREFDGKKPIALLTFLSQLREGLNALGVSEAAAVRVLAFLLAGDAKSFYDSVTMSGTRSRTVTQTYT